MLNKKICERCIELTESEPHWCWDDDTDWEKGIVACPEEISSNYVSDRTKPPPRWCRYAFQHAVAAGMSNVE